MSDDVISSLILGVPVLWFVLTIMAWMNRSDDPENNARIATFGAMLGIGAGGVLGGCLGLMLGFYLTRDADYPLPGLVAIPGIGIGAVAGAVIGAWVALRMR